MKTGLERIGMILAAVLLTAVVLLGKAWLGKSAPPPEAVASAGASVTGAPNMLSYDSSACPEGQVPDMRGACLPKSDLVCYAGSLYQDYLAKKKQEQGAALVLKAQLDSGERLEMYRTTDGYFTALVIGPDNAGQEEACEVATGEGLEWTGGAAPATPAMPSSVPAPESVTGSGG